MELMILGFDVCMVIPKPLCRCAVCEEAREKEASYARTGPSVFFHDENILIDTPAEIAHQLNRYRIDQINCLMFTHHLDPDHILFIHLEEFWNRSYDDYCAIDEKFDNIRFAYDGMRVKI